MSKLKNSKEDKASPSVKKIPKIFSIFWMLTFLLVVVVVVPLAILARSAIASSKSHLEDSLRERQLRTAQAAASNLATILKSQEGELQTLAASFEIYSSEPDIEEKFNYLVEQGILELVASKNMPISGYMDKKGNRLVSVYKKKNNIETAPYPLISEANLRVLEPLLWNAASEAMKLKGFFSSSIIISPIKVAEDTILDDGELNSKILMQNVPAKFYATVLKSNGTPVAALVSMSLLSDIQTTIEAHSGEFTLLLTDSKGNFIAQSNAKGLPPNTNLSSDPLVRWALGKENQKSPLSQSIENKMVKTEKEGSVLVTVSPVADTGILLFAYVPKNQFYAPIMELQKNSIRLLILAICSALLIGIVSARWITKPLLILTEQSSKIANMAQESRKIDEKSWEETKVNIKSKNEVGELADSFNFMISQIQKYVQEVETYAEQNKQLFMSSIESIVNAIDAKDPYTKGHSARVSALSVAIAKEYGFDANAINIVKIASLLHDVGKIGIEDRILRKPGALTDNEFEIMKSHPVKGAEILGSIPQMKEMIPGIKYHHERWSGGGYPSSLKGSEIPILARIVGIADAFDAMTTDRPYQKAMTFEMAVNRIKELTPKVYDPLVTEAFCKAYQKGNFEQSLKLAEEPKKNQKIAI